MPITALCYIVFFVGALVLNFVTCASWGVYLYEINYFFYPESRWWGSYIPDFFSSFLISVTLIISYLIRWNEYNNISIFSAPQTKWLFLFFILMCITSFYAVQPSIHHKYLIYHFKLMIIIIISYKVINSTEKFEKLINFYLLGVFYLGWQAYQFGRTHGGRIEGLGMVDGADANDTAAAMITAIPLLIYYLILGKKWQKAVAFVAFVFISNGVILINSRGAFLGVIVGCGYMTYLLLVHQRIHIRYKFRVILGIIIGVCSFFYLTDNLFWTRMFTLGDIGSEVASGKKIGRMHYWVKTFDLLKSHPFGAGVSGYSFLSPKFLPADMLVFGKRAVHSTYFQVLAEYGYVGFLLFCFLLLSNFKAIRKVRRNLGVIDGNATYFRAVSLESSFVCYLFAILFIDRLYSVILYWLMLNIACFYRLNLLKKN